MPDIGSRTHCCLRSHAHPTLGSFCFCYCHLYSHLRSLWANVLWLLLVLWILIHGLLLVSNLIFSVTPRISVEILIRERQKKEETKSPFNRCLKSRFITKAQLCDKTISHWTQNSLLHTNWFYAIQVFVGGFPREIFKSISKTSYWDIFGNILLNTFYYLTCISVREN